MSTWALVLILVGVGYSASLLTKFFVWLDTPKERRKTAQYVRDCAEWRADR